MLHNARRIFGGGPSIGNAQSRGNVGASAARSTQPEAAKTKRSRSRKHFLRALSLSRSISLSLFRRTNRKGGRREPLPMRCVKKETAEDAFHGRGSRRQKTRAGKEEAAPGLSRADGGDESAFFRAECSSARFPFLRSRCSIRQAILASRHSNISADETIFSRASFYIAHGHAHLSLAYRSPSRATAAAAAAARGVIPQDCAAFLNSCRSIRCLQEAWRKGNPLFPVRAHFLPAMPTNSGRVFISRANKKTGPLAVCHPARPTGSIPQSYRRPLSSVKYCLTLASASRRITAAG